MKFEWDEAKNVINIEKHGCDFNDAPELFRGDRLEFPDHRKDCGEPRIITMGSIASRVMVAIYTKRPPGTTRIISLRKANNREKERFRKAIEDRLGKG